MHTAKNHNIFSWLRIPIFCLLFLLPISSYAQITANEKIQIDSLKQVIETSTHDSITFDATILWDRFLYIKDSETSVSLMKGIIKRCKEVLTQKERPDYDEIEPLYLRYLDIANFNLGNTLIHRGDFEIARIYFDSSLQIALERKGIEEYNYVLNDIIDRYIYMNNFDIAMEYINLSFEKNKDSNDKRVIANSFNKMGRIHIAKNEYDTAINYYNQGMKLALDNDYTAHYAEACYFLGVSYYNQGNYEAAVKNYHNSRRAYEEIGDMRGVSMSLNMISGLYHEQQNFDKAKEFTLQSLAINEKHGFKDIIQMDWNMLGGYYTIKKEYDLAIQYFNKSIAYATEINDFYSLGTVTHNIGLIHKDTNNLDSALFYIYKGLEYHKKTKDNSRICMSYSDLGSIYCMTGEQDKALEYSKKAYQLAVETQHPTIIKDASSTLYLIYKEMGRNDLALEMYEIHIATRDSILSENSQKEMLKQEYEFAYEKKVATDSIQYEQEQKIITTQFNAQKQRYYLVIGGFLLLAALSSLLVYFYFQLRKANKKTQAQTSAIEQANKDLSIALEHQVMLQGEIHHRVKNNLQVIISLLEIQQDDLDDENAKQILESMSNRIFSMSAIHDILYQKEGVSEIRFSEYLNNLCNHFRDLSSAINRPIFHTNIEDHTFNLETSVPLGIIVTELITNSLKYGRVEGRQLEINISMMKIGDSFRITYYDNGNGFPDGEIKEREGGLGSYLLRSMTRQLQGKVVTKNDNGARSSIYFKKKV